MHRETQTCGRRNASMSWLSTPFGSSGPRETISSSSEEDLQGLSHGVKGDISQLTESFKRHLWGVASFLAPPPQAKDADNANAQTRSPSVLGHFASTAIADDLVDVDFDSLLDEELDDHTEGGISSKEQKDICGVGRLPRFSPSQQCLTGIGRDLNELKGSVATGLSKVLRAVREEIDWAESSKSIGTRNISEDADDGQTENFFRFSGMERPGGFDIYLKPLLRNIVDGGKSKGSEKVMDVSSDDDDDIGNEVERKYHGDGERSDLQETVLNGFRGISEFASSLIPGNLLPDAKKVVSERRNIPNTVGLTVDVLAFAKSMTMHPEIWLDFPSLPNDESEDIETSAAQKDHIHALEAACPSISVLRTKLCPNRMTEKQFWKIYFIFVYTVLNKEDALLLSTPEVREVQKHCSGKLLDEREHGPFKSVAAGSSKSCEFVPFAGNTLTHCNEVISLNTRPQSSLPVADMAEEVQIKSMLVNTIKLATSSFKSGDADANCWLNEKPLLHVPGDALQLRDEDDVSFSDLEDDVEKTGRDLGRSNSAQSFEWIQLHQSSSSENFREWKRHGITDGEGTSSRSIPPSMAHVFRKHVQSESDWSAVEEDDAASSDSVPS